MDLFTAIDSRASAVKLSEPAPGKAHLERIIAAGARAPDHGKLAPWRFVVLGNTARAQLGEAMAQGLLSRDPNADVDQLQRERNKAGRAPCIIAVAAHITKPHKVPEIEQVLAVGAAVENMFLTAQALGYGVMWKTGPAAYNVEVKRLLGLQDDDHIVALLYLGTVAAAGNARAAVLDERVRWLD
ncbi:MAG: nitroreductase [Steroidobacteraceae bacterium]